MALSMQRAATAGGVSTTRSAVPVATRRGLVLRCNAVQTEDRNKHEAFVSKLAMPVASAVAAASILSAVSLVAPGEALAARSGGRAGASSFAARRAAPSRAAAGRPSTVQRNYSSTTIVAAPPVYGYSPFGFGGFGFGGFMPVFPVPFFGGFLQLMFLMLIVSAVFNVVKGALGGSGSSKSKSKSQDWDDL